MFKINTSTADGIDKFLQKYGDYIVKEFNGGSSSEVYAMGREYLEDMDIGEWKMIYKDDDNGKYYFFSNFRQEKMHPDDVYIGKVSIYHIDLYKHFNIKE